MKKIFFIVLFASAAVFLIAGGASAAPGHGKKIRPQVLAVRTSCDNLNVDAGRDIEIDEDETVKLNGSVEGDYDELDWDCTGGDLSNDGILRPTYDPPSYYGSDDQKTYSCTLTARNDCDTDSDTVKIKVNYAGNYGSLRVSLSAKPKTSCAPSNNVDLIAKLQDHPSGRNQYTYKFDCENDGEWEKTVTTSNTEYTALDLCDYRNARTYTARVRVEYRSKTASDTVLVYANDCNGDGTVIKKTGQVSITKMVRNVSRNSVYGGSTIASPSEVISFKLVVTGISDKSYNVFVRDAMPAGLIDSGGLQVDGVPYAGNLAFGIDIGTISVGQTKTITYNAVVAPKSNFPFGYTALTNTATVTVGQSSANSYTTVNVYRSAVAGATTVSTGVDGTSPESMWPAFMIAFGMLIWAITVAIKTNVRRYLSQNIY